MQKLIYKKYKNKAYVHNHYINFIQQVNLSMHTTGGLAGTNDSLSTDEGCKRSHPQIYMMLVNSKSVIQQLQYQGIHGDLKYRQRFEPYRMKHCVHISWKQSSVAILIPICFDLMLNDRLAVLVCSQVGICRSQGSFQHDPTLGQFP